MDSLQLRCFLTLAETLHFGRAARAMDMLPATLGRQIKALEGRLDVALFRRTTRQVALSPAGAALLEEARALLAGMDALEAKARDLGRAEARAIRVGTIDSAAAGLMPQLLGLLRVAHPGIEVTLVEGKTLHLLPRLLNGGLDLAFCRPPDIRDPRLQFRSLFFETAVVALPEKHPLAGRSAIAVADLADAPLIVPDRRSRPHSHDLTIKLFVDVGLAARIVQIAEEKHTIVSLVASGIGLAIVPRWTARIAVPGVRFVPLAVGPGTTLSKLVLAAAWARGTRDARRDALLTTLEAHLPRIAAEA